MRNSKSRKLFNDAVKVIPGGVNSPVRAFKAVGANPVFIDKAKGPYLFDADGNRYIDYCLSWGPMILGHAHRQILRHTRKAMAKGTSFGAPTKLETQLAGMIVRAIDSVEKVRLLSSGTEAVMTAIRLARAYTGREMIIKFTGCYHGHADHMLNKAGSGAMTLGIPDSPGVPKDFAKHTLSLPYNNIEMIEDAFKKYADKIAAVIVEPVAGNMGVVLPDVNFLKTIRKLCTKNACLLIFDEVITGFRIGYGGVQKLFGVKADLTCLGKIIGAGFPLAGCGGKAKIMDKLCPQGKVYQAGTLSGNPVCTAAGIAALRLLKSQNPYPALKRNTRMLCDNISEVLSQKNVPHCINRIGSMFTLFFNPYPVTDYASAAKSDTAAYAKYFRAMLKQGIYLPASQFEACFISTAHTQKDFDKTVEAVEKISF